MMKKGIMIVLSLLLLSQPALALERGPVDAFVKEKLQGVLNHLRNKALAKQERNERILKIVNESFDFKLMAMLSLGKKHRARLSKPENKRYIHLFTRHLQKTYLDKLDLYTDEELVMNPPVHVRKKVHILTEMVSDDNRIGILYKLYDSKKKGWQIYDVEVEGVSLIRSYKSQFNEELRKGSVSDFLAKLSKVDEK